MIEFLSSLSAWQLAGLACLVSLAATIVACAIAGGNTLGGRTE